MEIKKDTYRNGVGHSILPVLFHFIRKSDEPTLRGCSTAELSVCVFALAGREFVQGQDVITQTLNIYNYITFLKYIRNLITLLHLVLFLDVAQ